MRWDVWPRLWLKHSIGTKIVALFSGLQGSDQVLTTIFIVILCFILWNVLKGILRGTINRSVSYAVSRGIPYDFAKAMMTNRRVVKEARTHLVGYSPDMRAEPIYVQYGVSIMYLYEVSQQGK